MATWGGRLAVTAALAVALAGLGACAGSIDQAHSVQTRLGRIDEVVDAEVTPATPDRGARITVVMAPRLAPAQVVALVREVAAVADGEDYPSYRLDLRVDGTDDVLVVDDTFDDAPGGRALVDRWQRVAATMLGGVTAVVEAAGEAISVESSAGFLQDVTEASRIPGLGGDLTWRFATGPSVFVVDGRVRGPDVLLAQRVQRTVASPSLPLAASTWRLESRRDHVLLDLVVDLDEQVPARAITRRRYAADVRVLVDGAIGAVGATPEPLWVRLRHRTAAGDDVFAWWVSGQPPVAGRDRLDRGWDRWLRARAHHVLARR
jgi:hypothetical protein